MAKKTNKTSHVLSLLTNGADPEETSGQDLAEERNTEKQEKAVTEAAPMESAPQIPASGDKRVVVVEDQEDDISNKILDNLEKQLESQEAQKADQADQAGQEAQEAGDTMQEPQTMAQESHNAAQEVLQPQAAVAEESRNVEQEPHAVVPESQPASQESQPVVPESQPESQEVQPQTVATDSQPASQGDRSVFKGPRSETEEYRQIGTQKLQDLVSDFGEEECHIENVMENIISRTDLKKYMDEYGVCKCSRCCADVKALILTRLPSKYVVVQKDSVAPMIGFYENKFRVMIFTEILKACLQVKEKPRHKS